MSDGIGTLIDAVFVGGTLIAAIINTWRFVGMKAEDGWRMARAGLWACLFFVMFYGEFTGVRLDQIEARLPPQPPQEEDSQ